MEKLLLLVIASFSASLLCHAQITKGSVLLGGGISAGKSTSESSNTEYENSSFGFYPAVGLAVKDNVVVGLRLSYYTSKSEQVNQPNLYVQEQNGYSAGLFYRRYLGLGKNFYLFGEGAAYYNFQEGINEYGSAGQENIQTNRTIGVNFYPGVTYAVSRRFHLEVGLNNLVSLDYSRSKTESVVNSQTSTSKGSGVSFATNVSSSAPLTLGFRIVLGR